ncbi:MAG: hypothetical protein GY791_16135 [Alphaproteobacteria bacterium]|nr:hypothetical protein [Alphaproteobacteria bacterium]
MTATGRSTLFVIACLVTAGLALAGCREDEQNRTISLEKGAYPDDKPAALSAEQVNELRHRAQNQNAN